MEEITAHAHGHGGQHGGGPKLAHHYDTHQQQFDAGKLGIWLFLAQEILFFSGLFVAYSVYRGMHPEMFIWAHHYLDTSLGAVNTGVLIISSLSAAWAVRSAQLANKRGLVIAIVITMACAFGFLGIKYVEYSHKVHDGLLWGKMHNPSHEVWELESFKKKHPQVALVAQMATVEAKRKKLGAVEADALIARRAKAAAGGKDLGIVRPANSNIFFGIYFFMTGLHGVHVVAGIILWAWLLRRALRGEFGPKYFGPIDYAALYWHLVDLIWIYLFPLLYLIH